MRIFGKKWLVMVLACLAVGLLVACGNDAENIPAEPATEAVQEEVSTSEMSEVETEEVSEEVSEEASEDVSQEEVEIVKFSHIDELVKYTNELGETIIVEYDFSREETSQAIISNGAHYTMQLGERLRVIAIKEVESIDANVDGIEIRPGTKQNVWVVGVLNSGTDVEVSFTVKYTDGTSEDFTIYITKES